MSLVLFPSLPFSPREIDPDFEAEQAAARQAGFVTALIDHARIVDGAAVAGVARVPDGEARALYRGWMFRPDQYDAMHAALKARGISLINTPAAYRTCHYLPESYPWIEGNTPESVWFPVRGDVDFELLGASIARFGDRPIVVKDYVKSQKHYWTEACFIPSASDLSTVKLSFDGFSTCRERT